MPTKNTGNSGSNPPNQGNRPAWEPTSAGKQQATQNRIFAGVLWALAIGGEAFAIFWILRQSSVNMALLIGAIVVVGLLAVGGDMLWKRANQLDPASTSEPVRFFIQNQLGAIIGVIAFLPMIVMIFLNKNMNGQQKGIAGGIGIVVLLIAAFMGVSINPPSVEQYSATAAAMTAAAAPLQTDQTALPEANSTPVNGTPGVQQASAAGQGQYASEVATVVGYTGQDLVYWKIDSTVYHLCQGVSALQQTNKTDNTIYSGTVEQAHAAGMSRLTEQVQEELKQCGLSAAASPTP